MSNARATERLYRCRRYPSATLTRATIQTYSRGNLSSFHTVLPQHLLHKSLFKVSQNGKQTLKNDQQSTKRKCFNVTFGAALFNFYASPSIRTTARTGKVARIKWREQEGYEAQ
ncbi:hypothetical protein ACB098_01G024900 [Castanea mollissima]